jgi:arabinan endo-1,5-alpha-L-arabinosidase
MYNKALSLSALSFSLCLLSACGANIFAGALSYSPSAKAVLASYSLSGDTGPMHDPSVIRQGKMYYAFSSDWPGQPAGYLPIRCSRDKGNWTACGNVFRVEPAWVRKTVPDAQYFWAPDVSYFNGAYHLYYAISTAGSQRSVIGLATNTTLNLADAAYRWIDHGAVLESKPGDDFNAIDPNILVDSDGGVWLTYGSYWSGIKQRAIDPASGMLSTADTTRYDIATRPGVPNNPIEGASLIRHGSYYYLFVSIDHCCDASAADDDYKEAVGRATSPHGPFVDDQGTPMMHGGATVILQGNAAWNAPGGATAWIDPQNDESVIVFHALKTSDHSTPHLWVKNLRWENDWPVVQ